MEIDEQQVVETVYEVTTSAPMMQGPVVMLEAVSEEEHQQLMEIQTADGQQKEVEEDIEINFTEKDLLPYFKKAHIHTRDIEDLLATGIIRNAAMNNNQKNALRQAAAMYRYVESELFRHGSEREYERFGLRIVVHDDEPQKRLDIITKGHIDSHGQHLGMNNTIKNVQQIYYWQGISSHVKMYLKRCTVCKARSKFTAEEWFEGEKRSLGKKAEQRISKEIRDEIRNLGRVKKPTPPETFFIVNAQRHIDLDSMSEEAEMLIDSNNIEYVVETLGYSEEGVQLKEVCHVLNVGDIVPVPDRFRSREIETFLRHGTYPEDFTGNQRSGLRAPAAQYAIIDEELYHEYSKGDNKVYKLVIHDDQPALKVKIMVECHIDEDGNHLGMNRTLKKVCETYFWLGMSVDVKKFMLKCKVCTAPREKKFGAQSEKYLEEVLKLKEKDNVNKPVEQPESRPDETLLSLSEIIQQHEAQQADSGGDLNEQVIRLVGTDPGKDVTEITVAIVDGKFVQGGKKVTKSAAEKEDGVTEDAKAAAQIGAEGNDAGYDTTDKESAVVAEVEVGNTIVVEAAFSADKSCQVTDQQVSGGDGDTGRKSMISYYKDIIYVCSVKKTRAIEAFLKSRSFYYGYTEARLEKMCVGYTMMNNGILLRCASRYKAKQIVIHDDNPELKLKLIEEHHKKPNGDHCSELITLQTILYKYYWDEAKADVHRFYLRCTKCVQEGEEVKTRKKIVSLEERAARLSSQRRMLRESGASLERTKQYRKKYHERFMEFKQRDQNQRKGEVVIVEAGDVQQDEEREAEGFEEIFIPKTEVIDAGDESDIEVRLGESGDEDSDHSSSDLYHYKMTFLASKDEEDVIKEEFVNNNWPYILLSMEMVGEAKGDTDPGTSKGDLYRISLLVNIEQQATLVGLLLLHEADYTIEEYKGDPNVSSIEVTEPATYTAMSPNPAAVGSTSEETASPVNEEYLSIYPEEQPLVIEVTTSNSQQVSVSEIEDATSDNHADETVTLHNMDSDASSSLQIKIVSVVSSTGSPVRPAGASILREHSTGNANTDGVGLGASTRSPVVVHTREKPSSRKVVAAERGAADMEKSQSTPRGSKRKTTEVSTPAIQMKSTPSSAGGRPRREIKRPRRYSPDREEPAVAAAPDSKRDAGRLSSPAKVAPGRSPGRAQSQRTIPPSPVSEARKATHLKVSETQDTRKKVSETPDKGKKVNEMPDTVKKTVAPNGRPTRFSSRTTRLKVQDKSDENETAEEVGKTDDDTAADSEHDNDTEAESRQDIVNDNSVVSEENKEQEVEQAMNTQEFVLVNEQDDDEEEEEEMEEDEYEDIEDVGKKKSFNRALEVLLTGGHQTMEVVRRGDGEFMCSLCDSKFVCEADCLKHGTTERCLDECSLCGKVYRKNQLQEYMSHMTRHEKGEKLDCEICTKQFYDSHQAKIHRRVHEDEKEVECTLCRQQFDTHFLLAAHMLRQHTRSDSFTCDVCNAKFVNISFMRSDVLFDGELSFFRCVMCNKP